MFDAIDVNNDGVIDRAEFEASNLDSMLDRFEKRRRSVGVRSPHVCSPTSRLRAPPPADAGT